MATDIAEEQETEVPVPDEAASSEPVTQTGFSLSSKKLRLIVLLLLVMGVQVEILDVVVDIRRGSPQYPHWLGEVLSGPTIGCSGCR